MHEQSWNYLKGTIAPQVCEVPEQSSNYLKVPQQYTMSLWSAWTVMKLFKGERKLRRKWAWKKNFNAQICPSANFIQLFKQYLGCSHVGSLFTNEEQTSVGLWHIQYFGGGGGGMLSGLVHHIIHRACWVQNSSAHGHVFQTFKCEFLANRI